MGSLGLTRASGSLGLTRAISGYFGRRYAPASRLAYSDQVAVPQLAADFGAKLRLISRFATDRAVALKLGSAKKGLANE